MTYWKSKNRLWQIKKVCWRRQRSIYAASLEKMGNRCRCLPTPFQEYLRRQQMIDKSGQRQTAKDDNSVLIRTQKIVITRQFCVLHPRTKTNCSSFNRHNRPFPQIDHCIDIIDRSEEEEGFLLGCRSGCPKAEEFQEGQISGHFHSVLEPRLS